MKIDNSDLPVTENIRVIITIPDDTKELDFHQLFGCRVSVYWLQKIADNISQLRDLSTLTLTNMTIDDGGLEIIVQMIKRCSSLTEVYLDSSCENVNNHGYLSLIDSVFLSARAINVHFVEEPISKMQI